MANDTTSRFKVGRQLSDTYDVSLIDEIVTVYTREACLDEDRLMGSLFVSLLRVIRANPAIQVRDVMQFRAARDQPPGLIDWAPDHRIGWAISVSNRHPMARLFRAHFPPDHRIWQYVTVRGSHA
jgi:hypothetical protein